MREFDEFYRIDKHIYNSKCNFYLLNWTHIEIIRFFLHISQIYGLKILQLEWCMCEMFGEFIFAPTDVQNENCFFFIFLFR